MEIKWTQQELNLIFWALDNVEIKGLANNQAILALAGKVQSAARALEEAKTVAKKVVGEAPNRAEKPVSKKK